jgi:CheY-like chemotaxis protein
MITPETLTSDLDTTSSADSIRGKGISVLLVEDDRSLRRFIEIVLERAGYGITSTGDGLEALEVLDSADFDIIITDAKMPKMNGYELCRHLRSVSRLSNIPIILLSALEPIGTQRDESVDAFLIKPVSPEDLLDCIDGLLVKAGA